MLELNSIPTVSLLALFGAMTLVILVVGVRLAESAERLAVGTRFGEAIVGGVLLGASTSLSGTVTSISAAAGGHADLAVSNAAGGIAVQTAFLAIADIAYRRANLEHAAASAENMANAAILTVLLAIALLLPHTPAWTWFGVHPGSLLLVLVYAGSLRRLASIRARPMWVARRTAETRTEPATAPFPAGGRLATELLLFAAFAAAIGTAGYAVALTGLEIAVRFDLRESVVGASLTAVATSLPELVTTLAAVHRGALQLAVGGIIGGNTFDVLFLAFSDTAYRGGSLYHVMQPQAVYWIAIALLMTAILSLGLIQRERHGPAGIGFESVAILLIYVGASALQWV